MYEADFPILQQKIAGKKLIYLDSAASAQKPQAVLEAIIQYYTHDHANVHRGVHTLSERASTAYESARQSVQNFLNATHADEIIFTSGATESINLVAHGFAGLKIKPDDEIVISALEHHANIVPWQNLCEKTGARLRVIPLKDASLDLKEYSELLNERTRLVAITHVSHVLGGVTPVKEIIKIASQKQIPVLLDGAQAVPHLPIDVQDLNCDFYVFSAHKLYGPTGMGVLYAKKTWLEKLPPYQTGGGMIRRVTFAKTEYAQTPAKFEAGTPHIAGAVGLAAAINYIQKIGFNQIQQHERDITNYALRRLQEIPGIRILPASSSRVGVISFSMVKAHAHDIATILNGDGIAVRAGHHCAMPLMEVLGETATVRISIGIYNNRDDIDCLIESLKNVSKIFQ
jgi:cysteine desulfurase/selenocysteine lyase